jgi:uncharacterized protein YraI
MLFVFQSAGRATRALAPLALAALSAIQAPAAAHDDDRTYRVVHVAPGDVLNIRAGPSVGHPVVGMIPPGTRGLRLAGECLAWCPVSYNGASGWVNPTYLAAEAGGVSQGPAAEEAAPPQRERGEVAAAPFAARKHAPLPGYWQVTGVAEGESLKVHAAPSTAASVVHAFEPQTTCIELAGHCRRPWCQVKFPGLNGDRIGWVDANYLAPARSACSP